MKGIKINNYFTRADMDTSQWEREIERLVYALYDLTEEEIAIVEKMK